jgi:hypothetical protein
MRLAFGTAPMMGILTQADRLRCDYTRLTGVSKLGRGSSPWDWRRSAAAAAAARAWAARRCVKRPMSAKAAPRSVVGQRRVFY